MWVNGDGDGDAGEETGIMTDAERLERRELSREKKQDRATLVSHKDCI